MIIKKIGKYFCYLATLACLYVLIGQLIQSNLKVNDLVLVNGTIDTSMEVITRKKGRSGGKNYELRIYLKDTTEYFRLMKIYKYDAFLKQIKKGDKVDIYIRPKWLIPLGMGYKNDIFQMSVNDNMIFKLSEIKTNSKGIILVTLLSIPLFLLLARWINKKNK